MFTLNGSVTMKNWPSEAANGCQSIAYMTLPFADRGLTPFVKPAVSHFQKLLLDFVCAKNVTKTSSVRVKKKKEEEKIADVSHSVPLPDNKTESQSALCLVQNISL